VREKAEKRIISIMDMSKVIQWFLGTTNFLIFVLGVSVFGLSIWVLVDKPSFLDLFEEAKDVSGLSEDFDIQFFTSAAYILLVVSIVAVLLSFFGCYGAIKRNKCMLATYFVMVLAMLILMVVGVVLGYSGDLDKTIKKPLKEALGSYRDNVDDTEPALFAYKNSWNKVQEEFKCCGVDNVKDWAGPDFQWAPTEANKPLGCCMQKQDGTVMDEAEQLDCRKSSQDPASPVYYFDGCYTVMKDKVKKNEKNILGTATVVAIVMFLNLLSSFAMCAMSRKRDLF